jgi:hypothetical protein
MRFNNYRYNIIKNSSIFVGLSNDKPELFFLVFFYKKKEFIKRGETTLNFIIYRYSVFLGSISPFNRLSKAVFKKQRIINLADQKKID